MKGIKVTLAAAASALLLAAPAMAFHDGGVAKCEGCHTMHNSLNGAAMQTSGTGNLGTVDHSGPYLLQGGNQPSDACLNCHEGPTLSSYHVSTTDVTSALPVNRGPGGDFAWLKTTTTAAKGGHNILGLNHGYSQATKFAGGVAPGGTYPVANLQCSSCHDPHGKYRRVVGDTIVLPSIGTSVPAIQASGSYNTSPAPTAAGAVGVYRILGGVGYLPKSASATPGLAFLNGPPVAVAPSTYNQSESANMVRVAYGSGMSEWCANCHGAIAANVGTSTSNNNSGHTHPAGAAALLTGGSVDLASGGKISDNYNAYKYSGNLTGVQASSFDSLVPFEEGVGVTYATLAGKASYTNTNLAGPTGGTEQAMCLSCHRVHASGFASMLRFQVDSQFVNNTDSTGTVVNWNSFTDVNAWKTAAYYDKPATAYGAYQRPLCNKCHAKD